MDIVILTAFIFCSIYLIIYIFSKLRYKKKIKLVENGRFVSAYFNNHPELRDIEYIPNKSSSINNRKDNIFFASTFLLIVDKTSIRRIDYKDIYWVYGEVYDKSKKRELPEILVLHTVYSTYRHLVKKQESYVKYLFNKGIPAGFSEEARRESEKLKNKLKLERKEKKKHGK